MLEITKVKRLKFSCGLQFQNSEVRIGIHGENAAHLIRGTVGKSYVGLGRTRYVDNVIVCDDFPVARHNKTTTSS